MRTKSDPIATVLIPTHDHGPTLRWSVQSALAQSVTELEIFIIGDGVPESSREIILELSGTDSRIRFFDHPKAASRGEVLRHSALREARGRIVCYLADDDLWLDDHVETMLRLLSNADFASAFPIYRDPDGTLGGWTVDLGVPFYRNLILSGENRVPLTCAAHTMSLYRRLPHGWRETPPGKPTDLHMWQQILDLPFVKTVTAIEPTCMVFPSPSRTHLGPGERAAELEHWWREMKQGDFKSHLIHDVHLWSIRERVRLELAAGYATTALHSVSSALESERQVRGELERLLSESTARIETMERTIIPELEQRNAHLESLESRVIPELESQIAEGAFFVESLEREISVRGEYVQMLGKQIAEYEELVSSLSSELERQTAEGGSFVESLEREISVRGEYVQILGEQIAEYEEKVSSLSSELERIRMSALWRARTRLASTRAASLGVHAARFLAGPRRSGSD